MVCRVEGKGGDTEVMERTSAFPVNDMGRPLEGSEQRTTVVLGGNKLALTAV